MISHNISSRRSDCRCYQSYALIILCRASFLKNKEVGLIIYSDDNNYEVCCYFVTAEVALAVNTSSEVGDKEADYVNACMVSLCFFTSDNRSKVRKS